MDSLTQMALGAAVGGAVMGKRLGGRAFLWGAAVGTLPDLDSFVSFGSPVADFTWHRGYTHALAVQTLAAPLLAGVIQAVHGGGRAGYVRWLAAVWLVLVTHALLDVFTVYGTQIALPFSNHPFGIGSVFIIDPLYTLALLVGIGGAVITRRHWRRAGRWNAAGLFLATAYLGWSLAAQQLVFDRARDALAAEGVSATRLLATPTPFNTVLWRIVAMTEDGYLEGFHRIGAASAPRLHRYDRDVALLDDIADTWAVQRLRYFTKGYYGVERRGDAVVISDLRMGIEPHYVFSYEVGRVDADGVRPVEPEHQIATTRPPTGEILGDLIACATGDTTRHIRC